MAGARVYLVDDHSLVRAGLRALVESEADLEVVGEADNGSSAIEEVAALQPDVVVMDVAMPNLSGAETTARIVAENPAVRVLALSAYETRANVEGIMAAGAAGYLLKRAAPAELARAIRSVASGGAYVDSSVAKHLEPLASALSAREEEVLKRIALGFTAKESAAALAIGIRTFETYRTRAMEKLQLKTRADIVQHAAGQGWLKGD